MDGFEPKNNSSKETTISTQIKIERYNVRKKTKPKNFDLFFQ